MDRVSSIIFGVVMIAFAGLMMYNLVKDHFMWRRYDQARELIVKIGDLAIDRRLDPKEAAHLMNQLQNPTPAALTMVRDRIEEVTEPLMLQ